jgi:D-amino-acid dehydrogenase
MLRSSSQRPQGCVRPTKRRDCRPQRARIRKLPGDRPRFTAIGSKALLESSFSAGVPAVRVLVLGAGVIGTTSAWFLRAAGHDVTVIDRQPGPARETSLANGGQVSVSHAEPWANPSAPRKLLKWLGREEAPLLFRLQPELRQWLWGLAFLRECLPHRTAANVRTIVRLGLHSRAVLAQLRNDLALEYGRSPHGILHFYTDPAEFRAARASALQMRQLGCEREVLDAAAAVAIEPALSRFQHRIVGADYCAEDESGDAYQFTVQLAERARQSGVEFIFNTIITRLLTEAGQVRGVELIDAEGWPQWRDADAVVVALGVYSYELLAPMGIRLQIYPAKGYSATFRVVDPQAAPRVSLTDSDHKLVISRFGPVLRVAGTAELAGHGRALNLRRCEAITRRTAELFADACDYSQPRYWAGLRPLTPSNVPYLGATRVRGLFLNTGHGTLGWTLAAGSGQLIADLVSGRPTAVPLPLAA